MLKTILVPLTCTEGDRAVLDNAYLAAQPFGSHIECLYVRLDPRDMITGTASIGMGMPLITPELWTAIEGDERARQTSARNTFDAFCAQNEVREADVPTKADLVTAAWHEVTGDAVNRIVQFARTAEMVVLARDADPANSLDQIGDVLMRSGRPVVLGSGPIKRGVGDSQSGASQIPFCRGGQPWQITSGFRMRNGLGSNRFCRRMFAARSA